MPVTLTDEQVAALRAEREEWQRVRSIAQASTEIWNDPNLGNEAKALWKKKYPDAEITGYDTEQRINARLDRERQEREESEKKARERELDDTIAKRRKAVQEKHGFTDDAMTRLEALMTERNVADYEIAASWMKSQEPAPSEGTAEYDRHFWHHDKSPQYEQIAKDPEGYAREEIMRTLRQQEQRSRA